MGPPSATPRSAARWEPTASMTARTSSFPLFQRGDRGQGHRIGDARASLVETEQPAERPETAQEAGPRRLLPHAIDAGKPAWEQDEVEGTVANNLIAHVSFFASGVVRLGLLHVALLSWPPR